MENEEHDSQRIRVDLHIHSAEDVIMSKLNHLEALLTRSFKAMANELDALTAKVTANGTVIDSAVTLIQGIKAALDAAIASGNPAALQALSDSLGTQDARLAAAILANTPALPPAP